jgi:predicted amino acid dehydrogenase
LGEKLPLAGIDKDEVAAAFLIHAMTPEDWWQTRRFSWARPLYRAGLLPSGVLKRLFRLVKPMKVDVVHGITARDGRTVICYLLCIPLLPEDIKASPKLAVKRAIQGAQMARSLGARCMGLGAYCSVIGNKGLDVQKAVPEMPITNGGAYTAGTVRDAVPMLLTKLRARGVEPDEAVAAVVGANGVVGFGVCRQLAWKVKKLIMIGTDLSRLEKSAAILRRRMEKHPGAEIVITTDRSACREADMLFTATSTVEPVITKEMVKPGAVIYDLGRPADVHTDVLEVPDVTLIPGGVIRPPGNLTCRLDTHFGPGLIPACMAETLLIALDECYDRVSLGEGTKAENIEYFVEAADRLGFVLVDEVARPETEPAKATDPVPA